jgi:isoleucyl-tRNA synthetase
MFHHLSNTVLFLNISILNLIFNINTIIQTLLFFRSLFVHGFVVDKNGRKMSKSIGNVIDPQDIVNGNYDQLINGIDILR